MSELKICRICLRTEAKGYKFDRFQLKYVYEEVLAQQVKENDDLPQWFCFECATMLQKFHKFKEKCYIGQKCLKELLRKGPITYEAIYKIDRKAKHLHSILETIVVSDRVKTFTAKDNEPEYYDENEITLQEEELHNESLKINNLNFADNSDEVQSDTENFNDDLNTEHTSFNESSNDFQNDLNDEPCSPVSIIVEEHNIVQLKNEDIKLTKSKDIEMSISLKEFGNKYLNKEYWRKINLTEDEAVLEFRAKAEDPKYLDAAYKCKDCFKGFSQKSMLNRHVQSRHVEELGPHECRFCRMRYKWNCHLRKHIQQHFIKYECLRCHLVFQLDTSAFLHEEFHSGATKKCVHCNEEFRHMTTYYTHLRTHRSAHVCLRCGATFVSAAGLRQHARRKHLAELESQESEDADEGISDTFCERCNLRFETRRAYEEHLFHSDMHTEVIKKENQDEITQTKKILGKRLQAKITKELRQRNSDIDATIPIKGIRRKKMKRIHAKPSTCHQCGKHFNTQAACMKHHLSEHPRTSFFAPNERHICELCGASLAPGSVAVHRNMHSREKVYNCDTCDRQFHSAIGLKRHLVTHTGEKPFGCPLCDKRFTQSNSMKLHYRTFHLKQPYPKRARKKEKDQPNQTEQEDSCDSSSDSLPDMQPAAEVPPVASCVTIVDGRTDLSVEELEEEENMHYLTLC